MNNREIKDLTNRLEELHAQSIVTLYVGDKTIVCDYMILASANSHRQMCFIANTLLKENGEKRQYTDNSEEQDWILVDLGDVMIHLMTPDARVEIDLESLWSKNQ